MFRYFCRVVSVIVVAASLSGCSDWQLRGGRTIAIKSALVNAATAPRLRAAVRHELHYSGVDVFTSGDYQVKIELNEESFDRRVLSVDPDNGKVREVELGLEVSFSVRGKDGKLLVPAQKLTWVQDFVFDESSVLGTREIASTIEGLLAKDAAQTIIRRLGMIELGSI